MSRPSNVDRARGQLGAAAAAQRPSVDLPQPDSPTSPSVSPALHVERHAVDRVHRCATLAPHHGRPDREVLDSRAPCSSRLAAAARSRGASPQPAARAAALLLERQAAGVEVARRRARASSGGALRRSARSDAGSAAANAQPAGSADAATAAARGSRSGAAAAGRSSRGIEPSSPHVYGCCGSWKIARVGPCSTIRPRVHDQHAVGDLGDHAQVVRDQHDRRAGSRRSRPEQLEDLRPGSSRRARSSARRRSAGRGCTTSAIAIITRWRMPPENWCG